MSSNSPSSAKKLERTASQSRLAWLLCFQRDQVCRDLQRGNLDRSVFAKRKMTQSGFSLMEVMVSIFIVAVGLLGAAGMQIMAIRSGVEAQQRAQALTLVQSMASKIGAQPGLSDCYANTTQTDGTPFLGVAGEGRGAPALSCPTVSDAATVALNHLASWDAALQGASELTATSQLVGGMEGARGCISRTTVGTMFVYTIAVAWQGQYDLFAIPNPNNVPAIACATGLYGTSVNADTRRRVLWTTLRIAQLSN